MAVTSLKTSKFATLGGVILAMLLSSLDQTIVSTAMPKIVAEFNGLAHLSWVFTAYMLTSTITVPIYGKLSDIFGRRGLYIFGIFIFLIGSALSGLAHGMLWLILFRGLQGIGGGAIMVNSLAIIADVFPPAERGKWQGIIGGIFGLAAIGGPLLGGWITDHFSWRWIFYINIPLGILAMAVLAYALPKIVPDTRSRSVDYLGAGLLAATLVPFLLALVWGGSEYAWGSSQIISLFAIAAAALIGFLVTESRSDQPILSLVLFRNRTFAVSVIATFMTAMGMFGAILYIPVFAQGVIGVSATNSGLILTPMMIALIAASSIAGQIISRTGKYKVLGIAGMMVTVTGMWWFSTIALATPGLMLSARMIALGLGLGITMPIFTIAVQSAFGKDRIGEVTAGTQLSRSIGGTVGTAIFGGVMNSQLAARLANIGSDPFVQTMSRISPGSPVANINGNSVQAILNPATQSRITTAFAHAPASMRPELAQAFGHFLDVVKLAFTQSVDQIFVVGMILMAVGLVALFFMPQLDIRRGARPVPEEPGRSQELRNRERVGVDA